MRSVGCTPKRAASALLMKGCAESGLIGPCPRPGGGSCQSATLVCQPKLGEARLGTASFAPGSAETPEIHAAEIAIMAAPLMPSAKVDLQNENRNLPFPPHPYSLSTR